MDVSGTYIALCLFFRVPATIVLYTVCMYGGVNYLSGLVFHLWKWLYIYNISTSSVFYRGNISMF